MTTQPQVFTFTVFTPACNRAHTLRRVYESLQAQTIKDFEWLIVDDGSTDGTGELVAQWQQEGNPFPIRYLNNGQNRGKHIVANAAVREARGELFLTLDSDDACTPEALERFHHHWQSIPADRREQFSAVTALCQDEHGRLVGDRFPGEYLDSNSVELRYIHKVHGEKWGFQRTDIMRAHPFPETVDRTYVPEDIVWDKIAEQYKTRYVNETLRIYYRDAPSLTSGGAAAPEPAKHARGKRESYLRHINAHAARYLRHAPLSLLRSAALYALCSFYAGFGLRAQWRSIRGAMPAALWAVAMPAGYVYYRLHPSR